MGYRCLRVLFLVVGIGMLMVAILPVFAVLHVPDEWATGLVAAKLLLLPMGAIFLLGAAGLQARHSWRGK